MLIMSCILSLHFPKRKRHCLASFTAIDARRQRIISALAIDDPFRKIVLRVFKYRFGR